MTQIISTGYEYENTDAQAREPECVHYWTIEPPNGPVSKGVCKRCGAEKDFLNDARQVISKVL